MWTLGFVGSLPEDYWKEWIPSSSMGEIHNHGRGVWIKAYMKVAGAWCFQINKISCMILNGFKVTLLDKLKTLLDSQLPGISKRWENWIPWPLILSMHYECLSTSVVSYGYQKMSSSIYRIKNRVMLFWILLPFKFLCVPFLPQILEILHPLFLLVVIIFFFPKMAIISNRLFC